MNGRVIDRQSGEPVAFALLTTVRGGSQVGTQADGDGRWSFAFQPGEQVRVMQVGYQSAVVDARNLAPVLYLTEGVNQLPPLVVKPSRNDGLALGLVLALLALALADD